MTIKELSSFTQKEEKTVRRWIQKAGRKCPSLVDKMSSSGHGKPADFTIDEVEIILQASSISKDAVSILMENARKSKAPTLDSNIISADIVKMITQIVATTVQQTIQAIANKPAELPVMVEAPKKDSRAHITQLVREYANAAKLPFQDVYSMLYTEYGYRTHSNPGRCAMNRELRIIDYIQESGKLEELEAVAVDFLVPPKKFKLGYLPE